MSGAQIGGIVGGTIGFVASGFNPMGAQIGYAIGASVGAYVDPVRTYGPRIGDSSAQTSSVGGVIPFGFGTFTTAGNLIWRDPKLREIAKTQRQGKGGGAKSTTYTYTRSYAVGICRGPIYGVKWIKRNGKKVYTTDPAATQEEKQASAKFAAKLKIYLGTETQMPDPTIVAVEGMANVPGHRGLAYIVVEHDDLTDLGGAVPQYEFAVIATAVAYATSPPYVMEDVVELRASAVAIGMLNVSQPTSTDSTLLAAMPVEIENRLMRQVQSVAAGQIAASAMPVELENRRMRTVQQVCAGEIGLVASPVELEVLKTRAVLNRSQIPAAAVSATPVSIEVTLP